MDIGIFSICYSGYGRFALRWCEAIARSAIQPTQVTIALFGCEHGLTDEISAKCKEVLPQLRIVHGGERTNMGEMRNVAVGETHTEWIQLVSIDDILLPNAIREFEKHDKEDVDVIACAYIEEMISGAERILEVPNTFDRAAILNWRHYWLSPFSPFRRSLWEERPYADCEYPNYPFAFDLARDGVKFAVVDEPCVRYIRRARSHSKIKTKEEYSAIEEMLDEYTGISKNDAIRYWQDELKKLDGGKKMPDIYQERYLKHQEAKKNRSATEPRNEYSDKEIMTLFKIMHNRRSQRIFNDEVIDGDRMNGIMKAAALAPSSCNRRAVRPQIISTNKSKSELEKFLVGGKGWIDKANIIILLLADMLAYKSQNEVDFMLYLDAGFVAQNIYLAGEALGVGACFVNPNVREEDMYEFSSLFIPKGHRFCGALALGCYDLREAKSGE